VPVNPREPSSNVAIATPTDSVVVPTRSYAGLREALAERYEIGDEVGRGGSAFVFRARDLRRGVDVALKVLRPEFSAAVTELRFLREIELVRSLEHPNVLPLLDSGSADGQVYFTMPLLDGRTLRDDLDEKGALPMERVLAISRDIARALDYAHGKGVIHRDIKPSNTLLEEDRAYVADFGIARAVRVASGDQLTDSGVAIGTPEYMSPEQAVASRQLDGRSDVYSLGCVVYHMLSGAPPFSGPNNQAIIARHLHEAPPPLHVVRPTISEAMERVVERALAQIAADRYATAGEFVSELEAAALAPPVARRRVSRRWMAIGAAVAAASVAALWFAPFKSDNLDPNRIVVFPLTTSGLDPGELSGEAVATAIGYTLEGTRPLRWLEGWELLDDDSRSNASRLTSSKARELSRAVHAGYFIEGRVFGDADSVSVALQLSSAAKDSVVARSIVTERRGAFIASLGLRAVAKLMTALLQPKPDDVSPLGDRQTASVVNFLLGESEYRRMQFSAALDHFKTAVRQDSSFALAALLGAQSADWLSRSDQDSALVEVALSHEASLPLLQQMIARGFHAYVIGNADSAVHYFKLALKIEPESWQTWTMLGEVYARLLPSLGSADSLSEQAFLRARELNGDFAPVLMHLERFAFRRGDLAAVRRIGAEIKAAKADSSHAFVRELMTRCLEGGMSAADWTTAVRSAAARDDIESVLTAGKLFSAGANQPLCARAALLALVRADSSVVSTNYKWSALLLLNGIDGALAYSPDSAEIGVRATANLPLWPLVALRDEDTPDLNRARRRILDSLAENYATLRAPALWHLGLIAFRLRDTVALGSIQRIVEARAASSGARTDKLVAAEGSARLSLLHGDSSRAIKVLKALVPTARRNDIAWQPWESLGAERLMLAKLLLARGDARGAIDIATLIDAPEPAAYLYWLRPSLQLRMHAAEQLRDARLVKSYRARLTQLDVEAARVSGSRPTP
jgi:tetratricopeptide (TPR) repeat protein